MLETDDIFDTIGKREKCQGEMLEPKALPMRDVLSNIWLGWWAQLGVA